MKRKREAGLFANDPAMMCRDRKGRYATPERAYADKAIEENKYLRHERDKCMRSYFAAADLASHWQRKYMELKEKIQSLQL